MAMQPTAPGVYVQPVPSGAAPIQGAGTSTAGFIGILSEAAPAPTPTPTPAPTPGPSPAPTPTPAPKAAPAGPKVDAGTVVLCTNFTEFTNSFGDFTGQLNTLAHAVYGFFNNGGTRCHVAFSDTAGVDAILKKFEAIGEIAMVAAPGQTDKTITGKLAEHCSKMMDRVAILDAPENATQDSVTSTSTLPAASTFIAYYYPWIQVYDPSLPKTTDNPKQLRFVPPSGHVAGIYARVDATRGVHKAPANEVVRGAQGLKVEISQSVQDGLNPVGVNCIRSLNGNILVWGARTRGTTDLGGDFTYVNVRRLYNFLYDSMQSGLQWAVFEPNTPDLWARITRNLRAFLLTVWSTGALFGNTPEEAFYVKCDAETNPQEQRERGNVIAEVGVAITRPAEFVIIRLGQWSGPAK